MTILVLGIDLGKNSCSLVGLDGAGSVILRRRMRRESVADFVEKLPRCVVAMEACCGAHHLGRVFAAHGHEVRLMSPEYVRPYVKAQKNDDRDAEAIAEAATRPTMRFVPVKSEAQSDIQALHRARARLIAERTALINHLRALLLERGIVAPKGRKKLEDELAVFADEEDARVSGRMRLLVEDLRAEWRQLDARTAAFDGEFARMARERRGGPAAGDDPRHRRDQRDRAGRRARRRPELRSRTGFGCVAGSDAAPGDDRRKAADAWHLQAGEPVSARQPDPWRPGGAAGCPCPGDAARPMGAGGRGRCRSGRTGMSSSWRWQPSWRGSSGPCCEVVVPSTHRSPRRRLEDGPAGGPAGLTDGSVCGW